MCGGYYLRLLHKKREKTTMAFFCKGGEKEENLILDDVDI